MDRETVGLVRYGYTSSQPDDRRPKKKIKSSTLVNDYLYRCTIIWVQAVQGSNCVCHTTSNAPVGSPPYYKNRIRVILACIIFTLKT